MTHEIDISWQVLRQILRQWAGDDTDLAEVTPLTGGSISTTLKLSTRDGRSAVLKITPHRVDRSYLDEAWQLTLLREVGVPVPEVYLHKLGSLDDPHSYILMEFIQGVDLAEAKTCCSPEQFDALQVELAEIVLKMHAKTAEHYMRATGSEPARFDRWDKCYHDIFDPIWREVDKSGVLPVKCRKQIAKVHDRLDRLLAHNDCPRLVHWDIWATNLMVRQSVDGNWHVAALLDPMCKYAHAEAEIAYMELFHTITPTFLKTYQRERKLPPEYHTIRKPVYQLYSLLNHVRLFGQEYLKLALAAVDRVAPLV